MTVISVSVAVKPSKVTGCACVRRDRARMCLSCVCVVVVVVVVVDRFYIALFSALELTHCALVVCYCD